MKRFLAVFLLLASICFLSSLAKAQAPVFGNPSLIFTNVTSATVGTNTVSVNNKTWNLFLSVSNSITTFSGYSLISMDGVHWITNGTASFGPLTNGSTTNVAYTVTPFSTNIQVYQAFQLVTSGSTNAGWANGVYGP